MWKHNEVDPSDRDVWRPNVRSAMRAASQLPGGEHTVVDNAQASGGLGFKELPQVTANVIHKTCIPIPNI